MVLGKKVRKMYSFDHVLHVCTLARVQTEPDVGEGDKGFHLSERGRS